MVRTRNRPVQGAWAALLHPATLAALGLLLLNDHWLRRTWPSPLTGKLGDFAWLFYAPIVAAALLELAWPRRMARQRAWAGALGFALVSSIFALAKTVPACHAAVVVAASALFGFPVGWRCDPTDLVALLVLIPAWLLWRRGGSRAGAHRLASGVVIAAAVLLTVANSPPRVSSGVGQVWTQGGQLYVEGNFIRAYRSTDGGMSWTELTTEESAATETVDAASWSSTRAALATEGASQATRDSSATRQASPHAQRTPEISPAAHSASATSPAGTVAARPPASAPPDRAPASGATASGTAAARRDSWIARCYGREGDYNWMCDPKNTDIRYRWVPGKEIERSEDGGRSWHREVILSPLSEDEKRFHLTRSPNPQQYEIDTEAAWPRAIHVFINFLAEEELTIGSTPALIDPRTSHVIVAMGHQGVLVRTISGEWWWIPVGPYHRMPQPGATPGPIRASTTVGIALFLAVMIALGGCGDESDVEVADN